MRTFILSLTTVLAAACTRVEVPVNTLMWRLDSEWVTPADGGGRRFAPATLISFRAGGEYIEHHCQLIEQPDQAVFIVSRGPRLVVLGTWEKDGREIDVRRMRVSRKPPTTDAIDPVCAADELTFKIAPNSVVGTTADMRGTWTPLTSLVSPDYDGYVSLARNSPVTCGPPPEK